jgi:hypothetical protein
MKIIDVILHKYKRLAFSAIETIRYTPKEASQIIIGTNGSGKSSLLNELNPLPPNKNDMLPGGYKKITVEHKGITYVLLSTYGKHHKHSFIQLDEGKEIELNEGGTGVAQKVLIEKIFGLTIELLRIWLGKTKFTDLPPIKRRDCILKFSGSDLDFAMQVYGSVKKRASEAQAVEKHFSKRLGEETADIADRAKIEDLERQVMDITAELNNLLEAKDNSLPSVELVRTNIFRLLQEFEDCSNEALTVRLVKPAFIGEEINNVESLSEYISNRKTEILNLKERLDDLYAQKETVTKASEVIRSSGVKSPKEMQDNVEALRVERQSIITVTPLYTEIGGVDINQLIGQYNGCKSLLIEMLSTLPDNTEGYFSRDKLSKTKEVHTRLKLKASACEKRILELGHWIDHYQGTHDTSCPKCNHVFKPGMQDFNMDNAQTEKNTLQDQQVVTAEKIKKCEEYIEASNDYIHQYNGLKRIISDNPQLEPLWAQLVEGGLYKAHPASLLPIVNHFSSQLENCLTILGLDKTIALNVAVLEALQNNKVDYSVDLEQQIDDQISKVIGQGKATAERIKVANKFLAEVKTTTKAMQRCKEIIKELGNSYEFLIKAGVNKAVNEIIQSKQLVLATANTTLNRITRHDAVIKEIEQQKAEASESLKNHQILLKTLSPVEGLISKYIQNFLDIFIEDINIVIADIWTTDLEILSCGVDTTDVTCKFPLSVNNGFLISPDISESSDGQKDIINFAFRMAVGQYLDLHDYPLYLDELAPTLDEQHRENLTRYVNSLMENNQFEQMFMISHYAANHYAFGNSEILMLDGRNILNKPGKCNTHVKLVYSDELAEQVKGENPMTTTDKEAA